MNGVVTDAFAHACQQKSFKEEDNAGDIREAALQPGVTDAYHEIMGARRMKAFRWIKYQWTATKLMVCTMVIKLTLNIMRANFTAVKHGHEDSVLQWCGPRP